MSRDARWKALLELLVERGRLEVEQAAAELEVSPATIRRDFDQLAEQQMLVRTRGGAVVHGVSYELPLRYKTARHATEKQRIAKAVADLVVPGEAVGLTGGTTTTEVARALAVHPDLASGSPALTVVTNALNIAGELAVRPQFKIVLTGGVARPQSYELVGPLADGVLSQITMDVAVLGVVAFDVTHGAAAHDEAEAAINRLLCERAERVIVAADSSKLGRRAFARICAAESVDTLVTDTAVDEETVRRFTEAGVGVVAV
ncbi:MULTISPECIES: DeoR/GlpR family DNA-binding transcription regulator [Streptomyces]|uniref:DeoR/GlpR family DNA-binding transcription regulator n=1 Tax=Streptomyces mirabilis TaxID=68239 RepID=A0ABU3UZU7_9ACTN|nr:MULTISPECIES: DeoR/GlpR family DNA-binding transcription regulator [Streptomyces]MCX4615977.1 DeoR/GlpR family DNA-binding transcription regulator [Streptomyces mirabilis]MCX5347247.1 DeoR/GlpR family DNA-binding transcription regulator [Streptomyces mirabilis]MDU8999436.1 DeoR/GlpR family DNA-binding transcription regulator [Streptomyces mirabilis]NMI56393.1 DeoR/GlpR transcriptional regulator [Streptomyces sp. RLA2-12]QDN55818.1 DeoR/GlpR transcriptional regulator [Streptomyces sp. S1D4-2